MSAIVPLLGGNAYWSEGHRRLHPLSIEVMAEAGVFRLRVPARYGGHDCDTRTLVEVCATLAEADGSAAWTAAVWSIGAWLTRQFPEEVQDEVFATPDVRICATLSPSATAVPTGGGYTVTGQWAFMSGAHHSQWQVIVAGTETGPIMALVPMAELEIMDDWYTSGLKGSGSVTTFAYGVHVPAVRALPLAEVLRGREPGAPLLPTAAASSVGPLLGLARAAMNGFLRRVPGRPITYTGYANQSEAPVTHLQVAAATMKIDQAGFHAGRLAAQVDGKAERGEEWTIDERARARADLGTVGELAKAAVDIVNSASGGSSLYDFVPVQRIERDVRAITLHALMHPLTNLELYGRVLCGLEPDTPYL
ncbi:acyl-CoA dehydrogenase family protein [Acrocarpospora catenulata]|uniref:acyl-CoA dehydrogenase family protein n=1 Tax=Acrocarpospora catenulata TaxID=2836182 RepID=UPI0027DFC907|nr:acyl-CoA dehydrogenase family protein [Acrocarpospora catenulata]